MEKFGKRMKKYLLMLTVAMMLFFCSAAPAFATEVAEDETTGAVEDKTGQMLELAKSVKLELEADTAVFNGSDIEIPVKRIYYVEGDQEIDAAEVFVISDPVYTNNRNVTTAENPAEASVDITGYYEKDEAGEYVIDENGEKVKTDFDTAVTVTAAFTIEAADISQITAMKLDTYEFIYDGKAQKPKVILSDGTLVSGTDYDVSYTNSNGEADSCINAGTKTVTVTGKGNYTGTLTDSFCINQADLSAAASMSLSWDECTYNGKVRKPAITITDKSGTVSSGNYTVTYTNSKGQKDTCVNAGVKTVTVTGKGNYKGTLTGKFTIKRKEITAASVSLSATAYVYNGKNRTPSTTVKIKLGSETVTLKKDTHYTVTYSSNRSSIGAKTVVIKGKGNYQGTIKKTYKVVPERAAGVKITKRTTGSLSVKCNTAKDSSCKYQFLIKKYDASNKKWVIVSTKNVSSPSVAFSGLSSGKPYAIYARIYKTVNSKNYIGSWSQVLKTGTSPAKPVMSYATKTGTKTMKVVWKAVSSATGYEIQYSTKSDFSSNVRTISVKGRTTTSRKISLGTTRDYYVRVRAYYTYNKATHRSAWSSKATTRFSNVYASYSTTYNSSNTNRSTNLRLACNAINGTILANGGTFSFNGIVGERTRAKGYKEAIIYEGGQEVGGIGGGICQVATTLFNAALKANFTIVERHQHSLTVHYCPLGYDAAIAWGSKNLRFKNNSGTSVKVSTTASGGTLSVKVLTSTSKKPPKVTTKVTVRNGVYTLRRYVNGKNNYTTTSDYLDN